MQHRGEIIKKAIYKSGYPITELAKRLDKSRRWMYLMFENNNVSLDIVLQVGKIIHYDFTEEIKEFNPYQNAVDELTTDYQKNESQAEYWKNKYLKLLEEYNELLKKKAD
jgi:predicted transcriptional regulator